MTAAAVPDRRKVAVRHLEELAADLRCYGWLRTMLAPGRYPSPGLMVQVPGLGHAWISAGVSHYWWDFQPPVVIGPCERRSDVAKAVAEKFHQVWQARTLGAQR